MKIEDLKNLRGSGIDELILDSSATKELVEDVKSLGLTFDLSCDEKYSTRKDIKTGNLVTSEPFNVFYIKTTDVKVILNSIWLQSEGVIPFEK